MAVDMFLKLDGIKGESKDAKKPGEIDVLAWSWGMSQSGSAHVAGGAGSGKVNVQDLSFTHYLDEASAKLAQHCASGKHIANGVLTLRKAGDEPVEYLVLTMEEILISSVSLGGSGGEDRLTENVSLNFAKVKYEYKGQDGKGIGANAGNFGWDIQANDKI